MNPGFAPDDPDFYLADPDAAFARLRREDPLHWYEPGGCWCVTKHADVEHVSRSPQLFTSAQGVLLGMKDGGRPMDTPPTIIEMDPPEHNRHRKLVIQAFTPRAAQALEPRIREIARELLAELARGETVDLVAGYSVGLPLYVIAEMLAVPREDRPDFVRWSDAMILAGGGESSPETLACLGELLAYFQRQLEERRRRPGEDLVSTLAHAVVEGDRLSDPEILMFCMTLLVAGNETTRNLVSGGAWALVRHPDQLRLLRREPGRIENAVEEMLRWWTPVRSFTRDAACDSELRGKRISKGETLLLLYGSANRDEEVWGEDSDAFDVTRSFAGRRHLAFGFGEHLCLGAPLARLEARVAFEELLAAAPGLELAGEPVWLRSRLMHGVQHLPVRLA